MRGTGSINRSVTHNVPNTVRRSKAGFCHIKCVYVGTRHHSPPGNGTILLPGMKKGAHHRLLVVGRLLIFVLSLEAWERGYKCPRGDN